MSAHSPTQQFDPAKQTLWRHADFLKLWSGQSVSAFGSLVSGVALPFAAVLTLHASPLQMGLLSAARQASGFALGLVAGAWVDRLRRKPVMIGADLLRAAVLFAIPALYVAGRLRMEHLYAAAFLTGALSIFFDVAYQSYLPTLIHPEQLVEGNSKLSATASIAEVSGFSLGGLLVQWATAPLAILIDAFSFLISALSLLLIRKPEPPPPPHEREPIGVEIRAGLQALWHHSLLRPLAGTATVLAVSHGMVGATIILFITRDLGLKPGLQGAIFAVGGISSLVGALAAGRIAARVGTGKTLVGSRLLAVIGSLCVPLASGPFAAVVIFLVAQQLLSDSAWTVFDITEMSLRQSVAPERVLGRINGGIGFLTWGASLAGSLLGGALGQIITLRGALFVAVGIAGLSLLWLLISPVSRLR